jgi:8-oxo-dGTP diphosphatase
VSEVIVRFHEHEQIADDLLKFAVIMARHNNKWIYCRHKERATYEIPGGHKEIDEDIDHAAERELMEETGATRFVLSPICVYSVTAGNGEKSYGKLYFADISGIEALSPESEIGEIRYFDALPDSLTYPLIQPFLYEKSQIWLSRQSAKDGDNMQIKMIVTDLDDTLLRTDKTISEHTISVLNK